MSSDYLNHLQAVADSDVQALIKAEKSYGDSWKKRGGVGAFMMLARKWDRMENRLTTPPLVDGHPAFGQYDIFGAVATDQRPEGVIDDIRDLRRYLTLVEAHLRAVGACPVALAKDAAPEPGAGGPGASASAYRVLQDIQNGVIVTLGPIGEHGAGGTGGQMPAHQDAGVASIGTANAATPRAVLEQAARDVSLEIGDTALRATLGRFQLSAVRQVPDSVVKPLTVALLEQLEAWEMDREEPAASTLHPG